MVMVTHGVTSGSRYLWCRNSQLSWSTYDNSRCRSNWLGYTGSVRFTLKEEAGCIINSNYIDYRAIMQKGTIQVSEIITE